MKKVIVIFLLLIIGGTATMADYKLEVHEEIEIYEPIMIHNREGVSKVELKVSGDNIIREDVFLNKLKELETSEKMNVSFYNVGDKFQCDDDPCTDASGLQICKSIDSGNNHCASNDYPLGTILYIEGLGECRVTDRMNRRYTGKGMIDWAMPFDKNKEAIKMGRINKRVVVLKK